MHILEAADDVAPMAAHPIQQVLGHPGTSMHRSSLDAFRLGQPWQAVYKAGSRATLASRHRAIAAIPGSLVNGCRACRIWDAS